MNLSTIFNNATKTVKSNSPEILTAIGVTGVFTTAYLTAKASFGACRIIDRNEKAYGSYDRKERIKKHTKQVWRLYIPAGVSGVVTVVCIIGASKTSSKRTAAAVTAYSLSERAFAEYREKVVEEIGKNKEQKIRDEVAQKRVDANPPDQSVIIAGTGKVLCCELLTGRYFMCDMESLRKAQNDINMKIMNELYVTLDEFYEMIGVSYTSQSGKMGWTSDKQMQLQFSSVITSGGEPALAFEYNYVKPLK